MLRGTPALMCVFLCLVFLPVLTLQLLSKPKRCSHDSLKLVRALLDKAQDQRWLGCRLYTPTMDDYQQNCPSATLSCFAAETDVLIKEWKTVTLLPRIRLAGSLRTLASRFNQTAELECHQCERHKEAGPEMFLETLSSVLEMMNTVYCASHS